MAIKRLNYTKTNFCKQINKERMNTDMNRVVKMAPCIVDGKFCYYLSLCTEKKPFSDVGEEKIKLEYPENNNYGTRFFNPEDGLINAITFMLRDAWGRAKNNDAVFSPHGQNGEEYEVKTGGGPCEYVCSHKPLTGNNLNLFNRIVDGYKKDLPIKNIDKYLEKILKY